MDKPRMVNSDGLPFDGEGNVVVRLVSGFDVHWPFASAIVLAVFANTINYIAHFEAFVSQGVAIEWIGSCFH